MALRADEQFPPALDESVISYLASIVEDWSISHGLTVRSAAPFTEEKGSHINLATAAPLTLFPSIFPRKCFEEAKGIQLLYNELYARISMNEKWLSEVINELVDIDDFIAGLWEIHTQVKKEGYVQDLTLGLFRSDYMIHHDPVSQTPITTIRQVEFNTIASSFGGLSAKVSELHHFLCDTSSYPNAFGAPVIDQANLPRNDSVDALAKGLAKAHHAYGPSKFSSGTSLCVLFVVQDPEKNAFDQKHIEYALFRNHGITVFRLPFSQVLRATKIDHQSRALLYAHPAYVLRTYEATTVYLRAGYSPSEYETNVNFDAWASRLHLERSAAIKCPSILAHLAGSKKVQQILATPGSKHLSKFLHFTVLDEASVAERRLQKTFARMYPLDSSPAGLEGRKLALDPTSAAHFVLKPQREGGGNNIYRSAIPDYLKNIPEHKWAAYILMEMIETPKNRRNFILRNGTIMEGNIISELGIYGTCLWRVDVDNPNSDQAQILMNEEAGYLLRTKGEASEEGGVAAGFGCVDSCYLQD